MTSLPKTGILLLVGTIAALLAAILYFRHQALAVQASVDVHSRELASATRELQSKASQLATAEPTPQVKMVRRVVGSYPEFHGFTVRWRPIITEVPVVTSSTPETQKLNTQIAQLEAELNTRSKQLEAAGKKAESTVDILAQRKQIIAGAISAIVLCFSLFCHFLRQAPIQHGEMGVRLDWHYSRLLAIERMRKRSNQALERTADRRANLFSMTSTLKLEAQLALVSGRSARSR